MLASYDCSSLEEVAALAEGQLRGAERDRVIAHLADCADCREVFASTVEVAEALDAEDKPAAIVEMPPQPAPRPRWISRTVASAAAALVIVGGVVTWQLNAQRAPPSPSDWLAAMPPATELAPHVWGGIRMRGGDDDLGESRKKAVELGALLVDAEVTLRAGDAEQAADALHRMATIVEDAGWMEDDVATLRKIAGDGDVQRMRDELAKALPGLTQRLDERFEPAILDLGTFAEEAQVAASAGHRQFLESRPARRYLDWLIERRKMTLPLESVKEPMALPESVQTALRTLRLEGASSADQAEAAQEILDTLSR